MSELARPRPCPMLVRDLDVELHGTPWRRYFITTRSLRAALPIIRARNTRLAEMLQHPASLARGRVDVDRLAAYVAAHTEARDGRG